MKNFSLLTIGWRSLCLTLLTGLYCSCQSMNNIQVSSKALTLAVLVEKGHRLSLLEDGDMIIVEDESIEERAAASIHFFQHELLKAESMRARLLAQGAVRVELIKNER